MDFREADRRYADLKERYDNGDLSAEQFRAQLEQIMVPDAEGRWWSKHRGSGEWHYFDGSNWVKDTPPGYQVATDEPSGQTSPLPYPGAAGHGENRRRAWLWVLGAGLVGVVAVIAIVTYLAGNDGDAQKSLQNVEVSVGESTEQPSNDGSPSASETQREDASEPPDYNLIETPDGSFSVEVPTRWSVETGEDSEGQGGENS